MRMIRSFLMCLGMFSAVPCPNDMWDDNLRKDMLACLPLVGCVIGLVWWLVARFAGILFPLPIAAACITATPVLLTGMMHLDGFMDTVDAVRSWRDQETRQAILKDVHCGSFAVVAAVLLMISMFAAAMSIDADRYKLLIIIPIISRCMSALCVSVFRPIGHSEYANQGINVIAIWASIFMLLVTLLFGCIFLGGRTIGVIAAVVAGYTAAVLTATRSLGGISGDISGYSLCVGELCGLVMLTIL